MAKEKRVKYRRVLIYEGPESWVKKTLEKSYVRPIVASPPENGFLWRMQELSCDDITETDATRKVVTLDQDALVLLQFAKKLIEYDRTGECVLPAPTPEEAAAMKRIEEVHQ